MKLQQGFQKTAETYFFGDDLEFSVFHQKPYCLFYYLVNYAYELYKKAYTKAAYLRHILFDMVYIASRLKLEKDLGVLLNRAYCIYGIENVKRNIDENHPDLYARIKDLVYKKHSR